MMSLMQRQTIRIDGVDEREWKSGCNYYVYKYDVEEAWTEGKSYRVQSVHWLMQREARVRAKRKEN